jgi:peptide/nickel transport system permease protein
VVTLWVLATIVFLMVNVLPGNVGRKVLGPFASEDDVVRFNHQIGTDRALISQYLTSIRRVFTLDFGNSYQSGAPVKDVIVPALFRSGKLALLAFVITIPISIAAGISPLADRTRQQTGSSSTPAWRPRRSPTS